MPEGTTLKVSHASSYPKKKHSNTTEKHFLAKKLESCWDAIWNCTWSQQKKKKNNTEYKTKIKEQKAALDLAFLVSASEKSLSDNYHTLYSCSRKPM